MAFQKATRKRAFLKVALSGPTGCGKTMSALRIAKGLAADGRIAFVDTENRSASLYAGYELTDTRGGVVYKTDFDVMDVVPPYTVEQFTQAIKDAKGAGYSVLIIDSFSHCWEAVLAMKEVLDRMGGNSYTNWNEAGRKYAAVIDLVRNVDMHVIVCMRSKMEYVLELNDKGKQVPRKVGLAPIARDGTEYEFSTMFEIGMDHRARDTKGRLSHITGGDAILLTEEVGHKLLQWVSEGEEIKLVETWNDELRAKANALVVELEKLVGNRNLVSELKSRGVSPSEVIAALEAAIAGASK